jgi:predicted RNase H-like HicB family nuclease
VTLYRFRELPFTVRIDKGGRQMKSYLLRVVVEPDEDVWRAYVPALEAQGAATWGHTRDEALRNIQEVTQLVVEELLEDGQPLPTGVTVTDEPVVAVHVA